MKGKAKAGYVFIRLLEALHWLGAALCVFMAALGRALVTGPTLLILADPTSMLDEKEAGRCVSALMTRWEADKFAVLYCGREIIPADHTIAL